MSDTDPQGSRPDVPPAPPAGYPGAPGTPGSAAPYGARAPQPPYAQAAPPQPPYAQGSAPSAPYGQPPASYPQASAPYGAGYGYGPETRTNVLAILSFIASLVGIFVLPFIGSVAAVIMGHIALNQLKTSGEKGRGLALAGTIIGWVVVGFAVLVIVLMIIGFSLALSSTSVRV